MVVYIIYVYNHIEPVHLKGDHTRSSSVARLLVVGGHALVGTVHVLVGPLLAGRRENGARHQSAATVRVFAVQQQQTDGSCNHV